MKKKTVLFLLLVLLFLMLLTNGLKGEEKQEIVNAFVSGNTYLKLDVVQKMYYVAGLMDMLWQQTKLYNDLTGYSPALYSAISDAVDGMKSAQIAAILDKYLEERPEIWHMAVANTFFLAIMEIVNNKLK